MSAAMIVNEINEKIVVEARFEGCLVTPRRFFWDCRRYEVQEVRKVLRAKSKDAPCVIFSVTDGDNVYDIRLDQKNLEWRLEKVYMQG